MITGIAILLELSTTTATTTTGEFYLEFLIPCIAVHNVDSRAFFSITTSLSSSSSRHDISQTHSMHSSRQHDVLLEEGLCRWTDTKWDWVVELRLIGVWDQVAVRDTLVVWSSENGRARTMKRWMMLLQLELRIDSSRSVFSRI